MEKKSELLYQKEAEKMMTPLQAAMTKARDEVLSHKPDFIGVGVSEAQIELASVKAVERAKLEFEQRQQEDPLHKIAQALENAAETAEEKQLARAGRSRLDEFRLAWKQIFRYSDEEAPEDIVKKTVFQGRAPCVVETRETRVGGARVGSNFACVDVLESLVTDAKTEAKIVPSAAYTERILRMMGVLEADDKLDSLKFISQTRTDSNRPVYHSDLGYVEYVSTDISGVDVRVEFDSPGIRASLDSATLQKVVSSGLGRSQPRL